jgi:hypothetical protein
MFIQLEGGPVSVTIGDDGGYNPDVLDDLVRRATETFEIALAQYAAADLIADKSIGAPDESEYDVG